MYQIYKITNQKNGMVYIGSSIEVERRWRQHKEASINEKDHHYNYPLMIAFREFGIANFTFEVIDTLPDYQTMIKAEHDWIIKENCIVPNGYNQTDKTDSPMFDPAIAKKMSNTKREKYGKRVCEIDSTKNIINIWNDAYLEMQNLNKAILNYNKKFPKNQLKTLEELTGLKIKPTVKTKYFNY